jgi:hypothetical protein
VISRNAGGSDQKLMLFKRETPCPGADHQRHEPFIPEAAERARHDREEDHQQPVRRDDRVPHLPVVTIVLPGTLAARMISDRMPPTTPPNTAKHR